MKREFLLIRTEALCNIQMLLDMRSTDKIVFMYRGLFYALFISLLISEFFVHNGLYGLGGGGEGGHIKFTSSPAGGGGREGL